MKFPKVSTESFLVIVLYKKVFTSEQTSILYQADIHLRLKGGTQMGKQIKAESQ